ncbi:hypothetical protein ACWELV_39200 [Streptomyces mirabilis]
MTRPTEVGAVCRSRAICGAAVDTIVPSSISMKKQPATRSAVAVPRS